MQVEDSFLNKKSDRAKSPLIGLKENSHYNLKADTSTNMMNHKSAISSSIKARKISSLSIDTKQKKAINKMSKTRLSTILKKAYFHNTSTATPGWKQSFQWLDFKEANNLEGWTIETDKKISKLLSSRKAPTLLRALLPTSIHQKFPIRLATPKNAKLKHPINKLIRSCLKIITLKT